MLEEACLHLSANELLFSELYHGLRFVMPEKSRRYIASCRLGVRQCRVPLLYFVSLTSQTYHRLSRLLPTQRVAPYVHLVKIEAVIPVHEASEAFESEFALAVAK